MENENPFAQNWKEHRTRLKQQWHSLTDHDLNVIAGDRGVLETILQEKYGFTDLTAHAEVERYLQDIHAKQSRSG